MNAIYLSQAIDGFNLAKRAEQLSDHTLSDYNTTFRRFQDWFGTADPHIHTITSDQVRAFLDKMSTTKRAPAGIAPRQARTLSPKTIQNYHTGLSALWTWAEAEGYVADHVVRRVRVKKSQPPAIDPFSDDDLKLLFEACDYTQSYERPGKKPTRHRRRTGLRDRLILSFLLDTGARVSELCELTIADVDLRNADATVLGKGGKERILPLGKKLARLIWKYLATRPGAAPGEPFIVASDGTAISRYGVRRLLVRLGDRAGVRNTYPHRFRHTYAIRYLRNGGQELALMRSLGHTTMSMTSRYARLVQADMERNHRTASPLDNLNL